MEIVHFAPFAPNRAGIYEAARDMVRADAQRGHLVSFVDVGPTRQDGTQEPAIIGAVDNRGGYLLTTVTPDWADDADVLVYHTGVPDGWVVKNQAPIVMVIHGRPLASFRPEQYNTGRNSYSLYAMLGGWKRVKRMVHFWPEFDRYWQVIIPPEKLVSFPVPPIDLERFTPDGPKHVFGPQHQGQWHALICDPWREDIDTFEVANGAIEAARRIPGLKVHIYSMEPQPGTQNIPPVWEHLVRGLRKYGALGELFGRQVEFEQIYRAVDFVMTPNRIVTRIIGESLACGTPVLAANGCKVTPYTADIFNPDDVAAKAEHLVSDLKASRERVRQECLEVAQYFSLQRYGERMETVYQEVTR